MVITNFDNSLQRPPPPPEGSLRQRKELLWQRMTSEFSQITDRLGMGIDKGIMETTVALSVHGLNTRQSCEGHLERGTGAPWVDLEAKNVYELESKQHEAFKRAMAAEDNKDHPVPEEEITRLYEEAHAIRCEATVRHLEEARKAISLLDEFYRNRKDIPFDIRLHLEIMGNGRSRIESQGAEFQEFTDLSTRQQKLEEYQEEMRTFTKFLVDKYYSDAIPIEPGEMVLKTIMEEREKVQK